MARVRWTGPGGPVDRIGDGMKTFEAILRPSGRGGGGHLVDVPPEVVAALGGRGRAPVKASFNGIAYRGSIATMGGGVVLGVTKAIMAEAGVAVGDTLRVALQIDATPREVQIPAELAAAFRKNRAAREAWERLSYTHRKEHARAIEEAKKPETRARRLQKCLDMLTGKA
jgi:hypothetical protein